jgi:hypothetical protein
LSKTTIILLGASLVLVTLPFALADETKADCETSVGGTHPGVQPWPGYGQTDALRTLFYAIDTGHHLNVCEGEHWDGQDNVQPGQNPGVGAGCHPVTSTGSAPSLFVGSCMNADPNEGAADPTGGNGQPLTFRVSTLSTSNDAQVYIATDVGLVGRAVVYQGVCQNAGGSLEGQSCGSAHATRTGTYLRDDTPGNVLATVVSSAGITRGHVAETDCNQSEYQSGAYDGTRGCGRDNTAISVETLLP